MKVGYSEFSYGYAFTENLIRWGHTHPTSAPHFPSLVEEGNTGYDVRINRGGRPLFFQYKVPEKLTRQSAFEIREELAGIRVPFFRMPLMRKDSSDQHRHLIELEHTFPNAVFYAAPCLWDELHFNESYVSVEVHRRSLLFSPREIGHLTDNRQHSVAYLPDLPYAWFCSEAQDIGAFTVDDIAQQRPRVAEETRYRDLSRLANEIRQTISSISPRSLTGVEARARERIRDRRTRRSAGPAIREVEEVVEELQVSRELARVGLGVELLLAQPST